MPSRLSLAEQIAQLEDAAPIDFDPEDTHHVDAEDVSHVNMEAAREHYLDVGPSAIRNLHDGLADAKYDGVRTSRKQLENSENEESDEGDEDEDDSPSETDREDSKNSSPENTVELAPKGNEVLPRRSNDEDPSEEFTAGTTLRHTRDMDKKKGKAVSRQIAIWETLLDARIQLQKAVVAANRLPTATGLPQFSSTQCEEALRRMLTEAAFLSDELFDLQEHLSEANDGFSEPLRRRRKIEDDDAGTAELGTHLQIAGETASEFEHSFHPYLLQTLSKWSAKVQAVAPSVLLPSNRNAFSKSNQHLKSIVQLIEENLSEHDKLLSRTQIRRGKGKRIHTSTEPSEPEAEIDVEAFDDTDFYQQLLKDIIDTRMGAPGNDDWMGTQKLRKAKKAVDTKASKGRKLRYEVHEKLQNFMVPVIVNDSWHDEQIDELFGSLLGKTLAAQAEQEYHSGETNGVHEVVTNDILQSGFRIFG